MTIEINVLVEDPAWPSSLRGAAKLAERTVLHTLTAEKLGRRKLSVNVLLSDDATIKTLNRDWRGKNKPTNVLSFPFAEGEMADMPLPKGMARPLGDIILARETLLREAESEQKPLRHHFMHLVVHGTLHLLGYDHMNDEEANEMENREREILADLNIPDPY